MNDLFGQMEAETQRIENHALWLAEEADRLKARVEELEHWINMKGYDLSDVEEQM